MAVYHEVDPISRIEGHLGVKVYTNTGADAEPITDAEMHGNLWRGFENFLLGRDVNDAITFVQRICGVCPVPHGMTSTYAVDALLGYSDGHISYIGEIPEKAVHIRNLVLAQEFLMSSITHFYHLVALDYVQGPATPPWTPFFANGYYHAALQNPGGTKVLPTQTEGFSDLVWDAAVTQYVKALRIRRLTFEAGALFAGRMPMTSCYVGGGVSNDADEDLGDKCDTFQAILEEIGVFVVKEYVPLLLALGALYPQYENTNVAGGLGWGAGCGNFLAWGAFPQSTGSLALPGGVWLTGDTYGSPSVGPVFTKVEQGNTWLSGGSDAVEDNLTETIANSHYNISSFDDGIITPLDGNPGEGKAFPGAVQRTMPDRGRGYSYIKSPRWNDDPCEVGPLARLVVAGYIDVTGGTYASTVPGYMAYTWTDATAGNTGLDPRMVGADLAVALVRQGLATLVTSLDNGATVTTVDSTTIVGLTNAQLTAAYTYYNAAGATIERAHIMGTVRDYIINLPGGLSTMDRLRARAIESLVLVQAMAGAFDKDSQTFANDGWVSELKAMSPGDPTHNGTPTVVANSNYGATEAPRGALAHFGTINASAKITAWQAVVPTTWNAGPKDDNNVNGPIEQAIIGANNNEFGNANTDVEGSTPISSKCQLEALRIAHTFDPCIACAIH